MFPIKAAIIGGGASGMVAALTAAARSDTQVTLFERQARLGRKLLATGNGRCNLSNQHIALCNYHGASPDFVLPALQAFPVSDTLDFFARLGLETVSQPDGRLYPRSDQANSVVDVLRLALEHAAVETRTGCTVRSIRRQGKGFALEAEDGIFYADAVIVCAGGAAGSKLGGSTAGYTLLKQLGHRCGKLYPSLVQIQTDNTFVRSLKGIRTNCAIRLQQGTQLLAEEFGEVQFTEYGVSGPAVFALSRAAAVSSGERELLLNLLPDYDFPRLLALLEARRAHFPERKGEDFLTGLLHNRLGRTLLRYAGLSLEQPCGSYRAADLKGLASALLQFRLPVRAVMGMDAAQVTAGGILTADFNPETLESRLVPQLYACGEVLDIDGDCGGYNLQWAWSSGRLAGQLKGAKK